MKRFWKEFRRINWRQTLFGSRKRTIITLILFIPVLVGAASLGYQYYLQTNPAVVYAHKLQTMTDQVSKSVALPNDETPVVATVTNQSVLPKEKFFFYAKDGDKILMYKKHKLAILYRPSLGVVITQAKLDFTDVTPTPAVPGSTAVAGVSTSAVPTAEVSEVSPTPSPEPTSTYHPQGKILIVPQQ